MLDQLPDVSPDGNANTKSAINSVISGDTQIAQEL
jgi:hypothetical protein